MSHCRREAASSLQSLTSPPPPIAMDSGSDSVSNKNVIPIAGIHVMFPENKRPFPAQLAVMSKVLQALKERKNALLESPTGTGKTLALLSSTVAYQLHQKRTLARCEDNPPTSAPADRTGPVQLSYQNPSDPSIAPLGSTANGRGSGALPPEAAEKPLKHSKIYFCSRTHSQISQLVQEFKTSPEAYKDNVTMVVLGSRKQGCVNKGLIRSCAAENKSLDDMCSEKLKNMSKGSELPDEVCAYAYSNRVEVQTRAMTKARVWDIEEAKAMSRHTKGCPFLASRELAERADLIFAPYNYLISPSIRKSMKISLSNAIIVFDEAHNIEDTAREAVSMDLTSIALGNAIADVERVATMSQKIEYIKIREFLCALQRFMLENAKEAREEHQRRAASSEGSTGDQSRFTSRRNGFTPGEVQCGEKLWTGTGHMEELKFRFEWNQETITLYQNYLVMVMNNAEQQPALTLLAATVQVVSQSLTVLEHLMRDNGRFAKDFAVLLSTIEGDSEAESLLQFVDHKSGFKRGRAGKQDSDMVHLHWWCLRAAVAFCDISESAHSVLLTSGTLSPFDSFAGELGMEFPIRVEASHVINLPKQVSVSMVSNFRSLSFNSTYQNQQSAEYLDLLGDTLYTATRLTPGGLLMFVPSYALLDRLRVRWTKSQASSSSSNDARQDSSLLQRISDDLGAKVFFEPKDAREMKSFLNNYYKALSTRDSKACIVAVCRGKVSEGINFSDHFARTVLVVGIPYPSLGDKRLFLKRKFQDDLVHQQKQQAVYRSGLDSKSTGSIVHQDGNSWYKLQAFRAINQAVGRCIRHLNDFGAILFLDPRFYQSNTVESLSRWLRSEVRVYDNFEDVVVPVQTFFAQHDSYEKIGLYQQPVDDEDSDNGEDSGKKKRKSLPKSSGKIKKESSPPAVLVAGSVVAKEKSNLMGFFERCAPPSLSAAAAVSVTDSYATDAGATEHSISTGDHDTVCGGDDECLGVGHEGVPSVADGLGNQRIKMETSPAVRSPVQLTESRPHQRDSPLATAPATPKRIGVIKPEPILSGIRNAASSLSHIPNPELPWSETSTDSLLSYLIQYNVLAIVIEKSLLTKLPPVLTLLHRGFRIGLQVETSVSASGVCRTHFLGNESHTPSSMGSPPLRASPDVAVQLSGLPPISAERINEFGLQQFEHWCPIDGVVYRLLCVEDEYANNDRVHLVAAQVIATSADLVELIGKCYGCCALAQLINNRR